MKKIIVTLLVFILLTGCGYDEFEMPEDAYINVSENIYEVFDEHSTDELISDTNVEILSTTSQIDTDKIGTHSYLLNYKFKKRKYKYNIEYTVIDNIKPIFIGASNNLIVKVNEENDLCSKIVYADNYDNKPACAVIGDYDLNTIGTYDNLKYVIKDSSSNEAEKSFNLKVVDTIERNNNPSKPKYLNIDDILSKYKNDNTSIGIDISKWQGNVDFNKVKNTGIEFVIMRIGVQSDKDEDFLTDSKFEEYYKAAKEANLKIGVYVYNTAISKDDGIKTAKWVLEKLNGEKLDFPIAYDWENWDNFMSYQISLHTLSESYLSFEKTLKDAGYDSMLYSSKFYLENVWMNYQNSNIWLAHYTSNTDYKGKYLMWQMTSLAKIDGITENTVDIDIFYKN